MRIHCLILLLLFTAASPALAAPPTTQPAEVATLLSQLQNPDTAQQSKAAARIARLVVANTISKDDAAVRKALGQVLRQGDSNAAHEAQWALAFMGPGSLDPALDALHTDNPIAQRYALYLIDNLAQMNPTQSDKLTRAIPDLTKFIHADDVPLRSGAIAALARLGPPAAAPLIDSLSNVPGRNDWSRSTAITGLSAIGAPIIPDLLKSLTSKDANTRSGAALALGTMKDHPKEAVDPIRQLLGDKDPDVRRSAVEALGALGPVARSAIDPLLTLIASDPQVVHAITAIGPEPRHAKTIIALLPQSDERTCCELAYALAATDPPIPDQLAAALQDPELQTRRWCAAALGLLGPKAKPAIPALIKALSDKSIRDIAADSLGRIGPDAKDAIPSLIDHLQDGNWAITASARRQFDSPAALALGRIGPAAVPALLQCLTSQDDKIQAGAISALAIAAKGNPNDVLPPLQDLADHTASPAIQTLAKSALRTLAPVPATLPSAPSPARN